MKRKIFSSLTSLILCVWMIPISLMATAEDATSPFVGSGTQEDPYQISTAYDLRLLSELVNDGDTTDLYRSSYYVQMADIDLENESFIPISTQIDENTNRNFNGTYDGNYKEIEGLYIERDMKYNGLFGRAHGGTIKNLTVYGSVNCPSGSHCGGILGESGGNITSISNCAFIGEVAGSWGVGGVVGNYWISGNIESCYFNGNAKCTSESGGYCGGIVGIISNGFADDDFNVGTSNVQNCYAVGTLSSVTSEKCGGIIGNISIYGEGSSYSISNNYYLNTMSDTGINGDVTTGCTKLASTALKACADMLGTPFVDNNETDSFNDSYPIFEWQSTPYQFKGSGTAEDPYQISSKDELKKMRDLVNSTYFNADYGYAHYIQTADIDLEDELWIPIGKCYEGEQYTANAAFRGCYNGNYNHIENLMINDTLNYSGLFGRVIGENVVIINLSVVNGSVTSTANYVGGLCGEIATNAKVIYCSYNGTVNGNNYVGGIVGKFCQDGKVENSYHIGSVNANKYAGGIAGFIWDDSWNVTIKNCYHAGKVESTDGVAGGIVGNSERESTNTLLVDVVNCYYLKNGDLTAANGTFTNCEVTALTVNLLKNVAADLGSPFVNNPDNTVNDGYPVFAWQLDTWGKGDINLDGQVSVADAVYLQGYLLGRWSLNNAEWDAADLIDDNHVDAFDMVVMRRILIYG